jgi:hypothetical protein
LQHAHRSGGGHAGRGGDLEAGMSKLGDQDERRALRWDGTVTAGDLLTAVSLVVALLVWELRLEGRVTLQEERQARHEAQVAARFSAEGERERESFREVKESLRRIEDYLLRRSLPPTPP